mmetsp:Transcript_11628/g.22383  ORF Transcript_11628/g.22383 Transcript_11628/m.22383 type:complete len:120 (-) Transcript_11628:69-428(-)
MNSSLNEVSDPLSLLGASSAENIGQITNPIPTAIPVIHLHVISTAKEVDEAMPIEPTQKINAAARSPFFLPNRSATPPAISDPKIDVNSMEEVINSTWTCERFNSSSIGISAPLMIPRS